MQEIRVSLLKLKYLNIKNIVILVKLNFHINKMKLLY